MYLLGWNHPQKGSLKERIDALGLHPVTCLTTLTKREKQLLLEKMIALCKDIYEDEKILLSIGLQEMRIKKAMAEAKVLCKV